MKKFTHSVVAVLAMGAFAVAGGDIEPVVEPVVEVAPAVKTGFYVGGAISSIQNDFRAWTDRSGVTDVQAEADTDHLGGMLQVGYKFNEYFAVETRYWIAGDEDWEDTENWNDDDTFTTGFDAMGIYLKPMYPVMDGLDIYALLGFALTNYDLTLNDDRGNDAHRNFAETAFSYGAGVSYAFSDSLAVFADYVRLYDDTNPTFMGTTPDQADITIDTWNFGLTYSF